MNIKSRALLIIILVAFFINTRGQTTAPDTAGATNIWLINGNKVFVKQDGATVDRVFFTADKVYIGSNTKAFKKEDGYCIIIYSTKGTRASGEPRALLSEATKQRILKEPAGTRIVFSRGHTSITITLQ
jgi:hypothetical protein